MSWGASGFVQSSVITDNGFAMLYLLLPTDICVLGFFCEVNLGNHHAYATASKGEDAEPLML